MAQRGHFRIWFTSLWLMFRLSLIADKDRQAEVIGRICRLRVWRSWHRLQEAECHYAQAQAIATAFARHFEFTVDDPSEPSRDDVSRIRAILESKGE